MLSGTLRGRQSSGCSPARVRAALRNAHPPRQMEFERGDFWVVLNQDTPGEQPWSAVVFHDVGWEADARPLLRDLGARHSDAPGAFLAYLDALLPSTPMTTPGWVDRMLAAIVPGVLTPQPGFWYRWTARDRYGVLLQSTPKQALSEVLAHLQQLGPQGVRIAHALADLPPCPLEVGVPLPAVLLHVSDPNEDGEPPEHAFMTEYRDWQGLAHDELGTLTAPTHPALMRDLRATLKQRDHAIRLTRLIDAYNAQ